MRKNRYVQFEKIVVYKLEKVIVYIKKKKFSKRNIYMQSKQIVICKIIKYIQFESIITRKKKINVFKINLIIYFKKNYQILVFFHRV